MYKYIRENDRAELSNVVASIIQKIRDNLAKPKPYVELAPQNYSKIALVSLAIKLVLTSITHGSLT